MSVIILNWNGKQFLEECLCSMRRQTFRDFETILVDNASEDGSADFVRQQFPEVRLLVLDRNVGFAGGNLAGYDHAQGELIVLLNNDTEAHPLWLEQIYRASLDYPHAGSFASKMLYFDDRERIENCGFEMTPAGAAVDRGRDEIDGREWSSPAKIFGACGGAAAYRRSMLRQIGFLDPAFFIIYEDVDLAFRAQLYGFDCVFVPQAVVYHRYRATIGRRPGSQVFYSQRNIELVYLKNMPLGLLLRYWPQHLLYQAGSAIYFLKMGSGGAFIRAKFECLRVLPSILRRRKQILSARTVADDQLRELMKRDWWAVKLKKFRSLWNQ